MLSTNHVVESRKLQAIDGSVVSIPAPDALVHLQFRRFAGCPICNLHVREVARRRGEIQSADIVEVIVYHSDADAIRRYAAELPFAVVADPDRVLYREFDVKNSLRGVLNRHVMGAAGRSALRMRSAREVIGAVDPTENHFSMPADFLIAPDGRLLARKYGEHADDQWSVDELLAIADRERRHG